MARSEAPSADAKRKRHRSAHRSKRRSNRNAPEENESQDAPNLEQLRSARRSYYSTVPENRSVEAAPETLPLKDRPKRRAHEKRKSRSRGTSSQIRSAQDEDGRVYVYRNVGDDLDRHSRSSRDRRLTGHGKEKSSTRATTDEAALLSSQRESSDHQVSEDSQSSEPEQSSDESVAPRARRKEDRLHQGKVSAAPPSVTRRSSWLENSMRPSERPTLRRRNTTTAIRPDPPTAYSPRTDAAVSTTARSTTSIKSHRRSSGLFSSLFRSVPAAPEKRVECLTCLSDDVLASKSARLACGHRMCHACLKRIFRMSVTDPQHMPPKCCTQDHIPLKHVERLFNDQFKILWNKKYQEYTTKNRIYCPSKGCGEWIKPSNIRLDASVGRKYGKCVRCKTKVCFLCNGKWHVKKECPKDEATKKFVEIAKEAGWQRCYSCKAMVELKEGCNHMTCRCTAEFCMLCGNMWKTCDCPWFNYETVEADRLHHVNVPRPVPALARRESNLPAAGRRPLASPLGPRNLNPNPQNPALTYQQEMDRRQAQERADEELARRLQEQTLDDPNGQDGADVWTFGNARPHLVNETYRNIPGGWFNMGGSSFRRVTTTGNSQMTGLQPRNLPVASAMAGLAPDGSRRGVDRVGGWLYHVHEESI